MGIIRTKDNVHRRGEQTVEAAMSSNNGDLVMKILIASVFAAVAGGAKIPAMKKTASPTAKRVLPERVCDEGRSPHLRIEVQSLSTIFCRIWVSQLRFVPSRVIARISSSDLRPIFVLERLAPMSKLSS